YGCLRVAAGSGNEPSQPFGVVPAQAGTQHPRAWVVATERYGWVSVYWVPACAGTTSGILGENALYAILVLISPMPSIPIFTTSPALRYSPGPAPTPAGVPVRIRSPGWSVSREERCAICSARV